MENPLILDERLLTLPNSDILTRLQILISIALSTEWVLCFPANKQKSKYKRVIKILVIWFNKILLVYQEKYISSPLFFVPTVKIKKQSLERLWDVDKIPLKVSGGVSFWPQLLSDFWVSIFKHYIMLLISVYSFLILYIKRRLKFKTKMWELAGCMSLGLWPLNICQLNFWWE